MLNTFTNHSKTYIQTTGERNPTTSLFLIQFKTYFQTTDLQTNLIFSSSNYLRKNHLLYHETYP